VIWPLLNSLSYIGKDEQSPLLYIRTSPELQLETAQAQLLELQLLHDIEGTTEGNIEKNDLNILVKRFDPPNEISFRLKAKAELMTAKKIAKNTIIVDSFLFINSLPLFSGWSLTIKLNSS